MPSYVRPDTAQYLRSIYNALDQLDAGTLRVSEKTSRNSYITHLQVINTVMASLHLSEMMMDHSNQRVYDSVPSKFGGWTSTDFQKAGIRVALGAVVRRGTFIGKNVALQSNSFVDSGVYIDEDTAIGAGSQIGACAHIGKNCYLSNGVGVSGLSEPIQTMPTIIGDNVWIGAGSQIGVGIRIEDNCVIGSGVFLDRSIRIFSRTTRSITFDKLPAGSVVVSGSLSDCPDNPRIACAIIIRTVNSQVRTNTPVHELLRSYGDNAVSPCIAKQ